MGGAIYAAMAKLGTRFVSPGNSTRIFTRSLHLNILKEGTFLSGKSGAGSVLSPLMCFLGEFGHKDFSNALGK